MPGVEFISINPNVETEPVGVGLGCQLPCWAELVYVAVDTPEEGKRGGYGKKEEGDWEV